MLSIYIYQDLNPAANTYVTFRHPTCLTKREFVQVYWLRSRYTKTGTIGTGTVEAETRKIRCSITLKRQRFNFDGNGPDESFLSETLLFINKSAAITWNSAVCWAWWESGRLKSKRLEIYSADERTQEGTQAASRFYNDVLLFILTYRHICMSQNNGSKCCSKTVYVIYIVCRFN